MTWYLPNCPHLITMPSIRDPTSSSPHFSCSEHQTSLGTFPFASNPEGHEQGPYGYGQVPSGIDTYGYNLNGLPQHPGIQYSNEYSNFNTSQYGHRDYVWLGPNGYNCQPGYHCDEIDKHKCYLEEKPQDKLERSLRKRRAPTVAQRRAANIRERRRMYNLNEAFDCLRRRIPTFAYEKRLSRIETLRLAISYISFMTGIVNGEDPSTLRVDSYDSSLSSEAGSMVPLCAFSAEDNNDVLDQADNDEENPKDTDDEPSIATEGVTDTHDEQFGCLCDIEL